MDNGAELTSLAMLSWACDRHVRLHYSTRKAHPTLLRRESFNGKFWDDGVIENTCDSSSEAREEIERWRRDYNRERPHAGSDNRRRTVRSVTPKVPDFLLKSGKTFGDPSGS